MPSLRVRGRGVELLIGHNRDEYNFVDLRIRGTGIDHAEDNPNRAAFGAVDTRCRTGLSGGLPARPTTAAIPIGVFGLRLPDATLHIAQAHAAGGGATFLYEFCFDESPIAAAHTTEIPLVFGNLDSPVGRALYGSSPSAGRCRTKYDGAWRSFAATGDPAGPAYEPVEQLTRVIDAPSQASQVIQSKRHNGSGRTIRSTRSPCATSNDRPSSAAAGTSARGTTRHSRRRSGR